MFKIISLEKTEGIHNIQSQSHRTSVWLDGYVEVPEHLIDVAWETCGYCDLVFDDEGNLTEIIPTEKPVIPEPETTPEPVTADVSFDELAAAIKEGVNAI